MFRGSGHDSLARSIRFTEFPAGTPLNAVYELCERKDGRIVAASDSGLLIFDPLTHAFTRPHFADRVGRRLNSVTVSTLVQGPAGDLWLRTATESLFHVEWESGKVLNFKLVCASRSTYSFASFTNCLRLILVSD